MKFFVCQELWAALSRRVHDEDTLVQIITTQAEADMKTLKAEFMNESRKALEDVISNETAGNFRQFLLTIINPRDHVIFRPPRASDSSGKSSYMRSLQSTVSRNLGSNGSQIDSHDSCSVGSGSSNSFQL